MTSYLPLDSSWPLFSKDSRLDIVNLLFLDRLGYPSALIGFYFYYVLRTVSKSMTS